MAPPMMTAPYSVGHAFGLHHTVPGGGGGISGYGWPSGDPWNRQNHFQTQPTYVNNSWASFGQPGQAQLGYYGTVSGS